MKIQILYVTCTCINMWEIKYAKTKQNSNNNNNNSNNDKNEIKN